MRQFPDAAFEAVAAGLVEFDDFGEQQRLAGDAAALHCATHAFENEAFVSGVLVHEDQAIFGLRDDIGLCHLSARDAEGMTKMVALTVSGAASDEEARVAAGDAELAVRAEEQRLTRDVRTALLNVQTAFRTAELQRQVAENASEELRMARERFRLGAANSLEVVDAQTRLAEAERAVIDAVYSYHKSLAALEALAGRSLR